MQGVLALVELEPEVVSTLGGLLADALAVTVGLSKANKSSEHCTASKNVDKSRQLNREKNLTVELLCSI